MENNYRRWVLLLALTLSFVNGDEELQFEAPSQADLQFETMDSDKDDAISKAEFSAAYSQNANSASALAPLPKLTDVIDTPYCDYKSDDDLLVLGSDCEEHSACNSGICSAGMSYTDFRDDSLREMPAKCCPCAGNSCGPGRTCWFGRCFSHSAAASDPCLACGQCPNITQRGKGHANITQTLDFQTVCKRVSDLGEEGWSCQPSEDDYMEYNLKAKKRNCHTQEAGDCFPNHWAYESNTWCKPGSVLIPSYGSDSPIPNGMCTKTLPAENDATKATCRGTGRICGKVQNNRNNWVVISKESGIAGDFALHTLGTNRRRRVSHIISAKCQVNIRSTVIDDPEIPNTTARLMCFLCCVQTQKRVACIKNTCWTSKTIKFLQAWYPYCGDWPESTCNKKRQPICTEGGACSVIDEHNGEVYNYTSAQTASWCTSAALTS